MGNLPPDELVARLSSCADALEEQAAIYPTSAILKKGIMDLISDAQRDRDGPFACPSIWEEEERETTLPVNSTVQDGAIRQEVYSKYSVNDAVQSLRFEAGDGDEEGVNSQGATVANGPDPAYLGSRPSLMNIQSTEVQQQTIIPGLFDTSMQDFEGYLGASSGYHEEYTALGADPRQDSGQPDLFMDSFWPLMEGDWMPGQM